MKRIEDAPEEVQKVFWDFFEEEISNYECSYEVMAHIFLKGFDTAMATGGLPKRHKRTVSRIMNIDGQVYVTSSDGKAFVLQGRPEQWRSLPDLPQD